LGNLGLSPSQALVWVHILVDYTHGAALAVAMNGTSGSALQADIDPDYGNYERAVSELLDRLNE
jgi:hypothetical protein